MNEYDVAIVGGGPAGLSAALVLSRARRRVAVIDAGAPRNAPAAHMHGFLGSDGLLNADEREQLTARAIVIIDGPVARLVVDGNQLTGLELETGQLVPRAAVFVRPRLVPNDDLLAGLGCARHDNGWVAADHCGRTSIPGAWVAGNAANPRAQVITAAGEGSAAAIAINAGLVDEDTRNAVCATRHDATG